MGTQAQAKGSKKTVLERAGAPTFEVVIELVDKNNWRVYSDIASVVDKMLNNEPRYSTPSITFAASRTC
jgi:hypothetical protein